MQTILKSLLAILIIIANDRARADDPELFLLPAEQNVYLYHNKSILSGHGFHVFRQDHPGGDYDQITDQLITGIRRIEELRPALGVHYDPVLHFFGEETAAGLFMAMRAKEVESIIVSILYPEAALALGRLFVDTTAPQNQLVSYRLAFVNSAGRPTGEVLTSSVFTEPVSLPVAVITQAENEGSRVTLRWHYPISKPDPYDFVSQFLVFTIDPVTGTQSLLNQDPVIRNNATDTHHFVYDSPVINTTLHFQVVAVDFSGRQSAPSEVFEFDLIDNIPPGPVSGLTARVSDDNLVFLNWNNHPEPALTGFHVYRGTDLDAPFDLMTEEPVPPSTTGFVDTTAIGGNTYYYYVLAEKTGGFFSIMGDLVMAQLPDLWIPPAPVSFSAVFDVDSRHVHLSWEMDEFDDRIETIVLMRRREDISTPGAYARVNPENLKEMHYTDTGVLGEGFAEGGIYHYMIFSATRVKNYSDNLTTTVEIPLLTPPDPPVGLTVINDDGHRANISWGASPSTTTDAYFLYRKNLDEPEMSRLMEVPVTTRFVRDERLQTGQYYVYAVTATDRAGNESDFSVTDTLFFRSFNPPRSVRNMQAIEHDSGVELIWERVVAADMAGYKVYRSTIPTGVYQPIHEGILTETTFFDEGGTAGMWYRVRAVDTSGNESRSGDPVRPLTQMDGRR